VIKNIVCIQTIFQGQTKKCKLIKIYAITHHNVLIISKNKKNWSILLLLFTFLFFHHVLFIFTHCVIWCAHCSKVHKNNIESLLKFGYSYSTFIKRVSGVYKSTIREYKRKLFPNMAPTPSGRHILIRATSRITLEKRLYVLN
jgi:hypothetical protein